MGPLPEAVQSQTSPRWAPWLRLAALLVALLALALVARHTGLTGWLTRARLASAVAVAGPFGALIYLGAFCIGELCQVPGMVFVATGLIAFGRLQGGLLSFFGAVLSVCFSFLLVRGVAGRPLAAIRWPFVRRLLERLEVQPIRTIALLRGLFWMAPQLNYALALSEVGFRDYLVGSALGLTVPIAALTLLSRPLGSLLERLFG